MFTKHTSSSLLGTQEREALQSRPVRCPWSSGGRSSRPRSPEGGVEPREARRLGPSGTPLRGRGSLPETPLHVRGAARRQLTHRDPSSPGCLFLSESELQAL